MEYDYIRKGRITWHHANYSPLHFIATSNKTTFNKDDVTFNIAYATHQAQIDNPRYLYDSPPNDHTYFALYIYNGDITFEEHFEKTATGFNTIEKLSNIDGFTFVKGINEEEALSKEYSLLITPFFISDGSVYQHTEEITIPREYVNQEQGTFMLEFICFQFENYAEPHSYFPYTSLTIRFEYYEIDENTIEIRFNKMNWWNNEL